jgi:hypothetical protein
MFSALRKHGPEDFIETACLGIFMILAGGFPALLEYPNSPVPRATPNDFVRLAFNGLALGLTAIRLNNPGAIAFAKDL